MAMSDGRTQLPVELLELPVPVKFTRLDDEPPPVDEDDD